MTTPSAHIHADPTATPAATDPRWRAWSAAWTTQAKTLTGRGDLTVTVAPGAGRGAPACHIPALHAIEVDAALIGNPTIANPYRAGHKAKVPAAYGALVHEAAHAAHSHWQPPAGTPPVLAEVAAMLEESRAELRQRQRRPRDRQWLRHCVRAIVAPTQVPTDSAWHAAWAAGLLLARVDTRVLTHADTRALRRAVTGVLGTKLLRGLRRIWRDAHTVADTDADTMIALARQWCAALGIDPDTAPELPETPAGASGGRVAAAISAVLDGIAGHSEQPPSGHHASSDIPASWTARPPTDDEQQAAARLAVLLRRARTRERSLTLEHTAAPPGRLRTRHAVTAAAQKAAGAVPTAQPWQRTTRRPVPDPDLAVAVLVDVSGSMRAFAGPLSSAAWILAHAATRAGATSTTIAFGDKVTVLIPPGQRPTHVRDMRADSGTERFDEAVAEADRLLGLTTPGKVRLVVVVSDGWLADPDAAQTTITRLLATGATILWLTPADRPTRTYTGPTTLAVDTPTACVHLIGRAATEALARA